MLSEDTLKRIIADILDSVGFRVSTLPPDQINKTPDFNVLGKEDAYTIELKIKGDDPEEELGYESLHSGGEVAVKTTPLSYRNRLGGVIGSGVRQLQQHDPEGQTFHLLWLHCEGSDPELHSERYLATLYGSETLFCDGAENLVTCYYFHESSFFTWRDSLDGAFITYQTGSQQMKMILCVNTLSPRVQAFRKSELPISLPGTVFDPEGRYGLENNTMNADCDIPRSQTDGVIAYLIEKYSVERIMPIPMKKLEARVRFPLGKPQND